MNWILGLDGDVNMNEDWKGPWNYDVGFLLYSGNENLKLERGSC
jgi:hypothetical protein